MLLPAADGARLVRTHKEGGIHCGWINEHVLKVQLLQARRETDRADLGAMTSLALGSELVTG